MPFPGNKHYLSYAEWLKAQYGGRLQKVVIDAGFSCPNRDGSIGSGGCTYCLNQAFHPNYSHPGLGLHRQIDEGIVFHERRYPRNKGYLAYFQSFSNTYAPLERLQEVYETALSHPQIVGLVIGTRPDCVDASKLDYLASLARKHFICVEYGIESCYDHSLQRIHRGHSFAQAQQAVADTAARGLQVGAHFIFGLPGETIPDMLASAPLINRLPLHSVKFHQLQIVKGTPMEAEFADCPQDFVQFGLEAYIDFFVDFLEQLRPDLAIERFAGELPPRFVSHTPWGLVRNVDLLRMLDARLEARQTYQGRLFSAQP